MESRKEIVTYKDLQKTGWGHSLEPMVPLSLFTVGTQPWATDMQLYTGEEIFVRQQVAEKLAKVNKILRGKFDAELVVAYGYRHPEIQMKYFQDLLKSKLIKDFKKGKRLTKLELHNFAHNLIAVPFVAGHPTGGAVDVTLYRDGFLDMWTEIADFSSPEKVPTYSELITKKQLKNRLLLRECMMKEGFAPFNGEWWHFSFGDIEWAYWNDQKEALYDSINFTFRTTTIEEILV